MAKPKLMNARWLFGWWGTAFVETNVPNTMQGGNLYCYALVRPSWYWFCSRVWLFLCIVWRDYDGGRMDWTTAWTVSKVASGFTVRKAKP